MRASSASFASSRRASVALYLLDTNVIIRVLRAKSPAGDLLRGLVRSGNTLASCSITVAEVYSGMRAHEETVTRAFLNALEFLPATPQVAETAGLLRRDWQRMGRALSISDTLIAAVAIEYHCILLTENVKDFPMPGLRLQAP